MSPNEIQARLIPPGTPRKRVIVAGVLVVAALAVLVANLVGSGEEPDLALAMDSDDDGYVDGDQPAAPPTRSPATIASSPAAPEAASPAQPAPAASMPSAAEPDWQGLFDQLLARTESGSAGSGPATADLRVAGILASRDGALALIDGRLLRVGEDVPGTRYTVTAILADRVVLEAPGRPAALTLRLDPLGDA